MSGDGPGLDPGAIKAITGNKKLAKMASAVAVESDNGEATSSDDGSSSEGEGSKDDDADSNGSTSSVSVKKHARSTPQKTSKLRSRGGKDEVSEPPKKRPRLLEVQSSGSPASHKKKPQCLQSGSGEVANGMTPSQFLLAHKAFVKAIRS